MHPIRISTDLPRVLGVSAAILFAGAGLAQPPSTQPPAPASTPSKPARPDPGRDPALNDPNLDDDAAGKRRPAAPAAVPVTNPPTLPGAVPAARPAGPIPPAGAATGPSIPKGTLLPEGTFLSSRPGAIVKSPGGTFLFVPSEAGAGMSKPVPMVLLWNQRLSQVASAIEGNEAAAASVSGQAFVYKGRQHLLLSVFSMTRSSDAPKLTPGGKAPPLPNANADVRALMEELDARPSAPRAMDQRVLSAVEPSTARGSKDAVIAEGTVITGRRARLVRGPGGLTVTFDNGPGNPGLPPMQLLPCRLLEQLESLAASRGENLTIRLSGRTTVHGGLNYLLPTMYQIIRPGDLRPIQ